MAVILSSREALVGALVASWEQGKQIGFVPTMGALHEGHGSLIQQSRKENEVLVLSIYVNPRQFNDSLDFEHYPRPIEKDLKLAREQGVDFVYLPVYEELFTAETTLPKVDLMGLDQVMEGVSRPGHFRGVMEVVYALFMHVKPTNAYFGQKDFQQLAIIKSMVRQLKLSVHILACPTLRAPDGLALSSRNLRLSHDQRHEALVLFRALNEVKKAWKHKPTATLKAEAEAVINQSNLRLDYLEIVDANTLGPITVNTTEAVVCVAAFCGNIRLIDNMLLNAD